MSTGPAISMWYSVAMTNILELTPFARWAVRVENFRRLFQEDDFSCKFDVINCSISVVGNSFRVDIVIVFIDSQPGREPLSNQILSYTPASGHNVVV